MTSKKLPSLSLYLKKIMHCRRLFIDTVFSYEIEFSTSGKQNNFTVTFYLCQSIYYRFILITLISFKCTFERLTSF